MFETLTMRAGMLVAVAVVVLLASVGCDKRPGPGPTPPATPPLPTVAPAATPQVSSDPSLPDAKATLRAGDAGRPQALASAAQRSAPAHPAMTRAQEATAMPLPGQANDHSSLALDPPPKRAASAP